MLVSDSAPRQAKLLGTDEGLMFPDAPTVSGKIFLAHLDRFILERGCHCIVPPVHEAEQRYSADDLDDLVFVPVVPQFGKQGVSDSVRNLGRGQGKIERDPLGLTGADS